MDTLRFVVATDVWAIGKRMGAFRRRAMLGVIGSGLAFGLRRGDFLRL